MVYSYKECKDKYKTDYNIKKEMVAGNLRRVSRGIYTDDKCESDLDTVSKKYPYSVFTTNSAFYYLGLTDTIPKGYYLATDKNATKIKNKKVKQFFDNNGCLELGMIEMERDGPLIRIYNKERMLVELIRHKNKLPFDYYKEIIASYRRLIYDIDVQEVQEYAMQLPRTNKVMETIQMEVF